MKRDAGHAEIYPSFVTHYGTDIIFREMLFYINSKSIITCCYSILTAPVFTYNPVLQKTISHGTSR